MILYSYVDRVEGTTLVLILVVCRYVLCTGVRLRSLFFRACLLSRKMMEMSLSLYMYDVIGGDMSKSYLT